MSNIIDNDKQNNLPSNRLDDMAAMTPPAVPVTKVKPVIPNPAAKPTAEALIAAVQQQQAAFRTESQAPEKPADYTGVATMDTIAVRPAATRDFSLMTEDDVYNLDIPMEARPFSNEDSLRVVLTDSGMVARWVNKDSRRLGAMIAKGFSYVVQRDLAEKLEVEVSADAEGHFALGDVILMKISKERYFTALRAAHLRAMNSVGSKGAHKQALAVANEYMSKEVGGGFKQEAEDNKVAFYTPGITI